MAVIFTGMFIAFFLIISYLPDGITFTKALDIAGASGKMNMLDFSFDMNNRYTFWSGIIGGSFLAVSYFGTDQSQVQRYLSGKSVKEMQLGLIFNGLLKVPMQFFILLVGVMVFVFYQFNPTPLHFNPAAEEAIVQSQFSDYYKELEDTHAELEKERSLLQLQIAEGTLSYEDKNKIKELESLDKEIREDAKKMIAQLDEKIETNDKDYVFIHFILNKLPKGLIGLLLAVILSAAMSSTASELNALGSTTALDLYKRNVTIEHSEKHYVAMSKWFTLLWGIIAIIIACVANLFDNLIQLVNIIGSIFYGNVLGIFLLAFFIRFVKGNAVFIAAIITQIVILGIYYFAIYVPESVGEKALSYLWLNLIGCGLVMVLAVFLQLFSYKKES
jgi:Na+/proline symporter